MSIVVDLKRLDLAETVQFPIRVGFQLIVSCICTAKRDVRIVDPVLLLRAANGLCRAIAAHVRTLEHLVMRGKHDVIARDHCARCKANLRRCNGRVRRMVDFRRAVVDLRNLCKRTRKILRCDRSLRRKVQSLLCIFRMCRCTVFVCKCIVLPNIAANRNIVGDGLLDDIAGGIARDALVCIAARDGHHGVIVHLRAVLRAHELVVIRRPRRIGDVRLRIRIDECAVM